MKLFQRLMVTLNFDGIEKHVSITSLLAVVSYELGVNFNECEEVTTGVEYLENSLKILREEPSNLVYSSLAIAIHNQLAIIWSRRSSFEKALEFLTSAEKEYTTQHELGIYPMHFDEVWNPSNDVESRKAKFEDLHTLTLYYLAQIYGSFRKTRCVSKVLSYNFSTSDGSKNIRST